jgi:hypothetical protein
MKYFVANDGNAKSRVVGGVEDNTSNQGTIEGACYCSIFRGTVVYGDELVCLACDKYICIETEIISYWRYNKACSRRSVSTLVQPLLAVVR